MNGFTRPPELRVLTSDSNRNNDRTSFSFNSGVSGALPSPCSPLPSPVSPLVLPASPSSNTSSSRPSLLSFDRRIDNGASSNPAVQHRQIGSPGLPSPGHSQLDPAGSPVPGTNLQTRGVAINVPAVSVLHMRHSSSTSTCSESAQAVQHGPSDTSCQFMEGMVTTVLSQHADSFHPQVILVR